MSEARYEEIAEAMRAADDDLLTPVAHARMHQLIARRRKPAQPLSWARLGSTQANR